MSTPMASENGRSPHVSEFRSSPIGRASSDTPAHPAPDTRFFQFVPPPSTSDAKVPTASLTHSHRYDCSTSAPHRRFLPAPPGRPTTTCDLTLSGHHTVVESVRSRGGGRIFAKRKPRSGG